MTYKCNFFLLSPLNFVLHHTITLGMSVLVENTQCPFILHFQYYFQNNVLGN